MKAQRMLDRLSSFNEATTQLVSWLEPGGFCCPSVQRKHGYCTNPRCVRRREDNAVYWAHRAARLGRWVLALAKKAPQPVAPDAGEPQPPAVAPTPRTEP